MYLPTMRWTVPYAVHPHLYLDGYGEFDERDGIL